MAEARRKNYKKWTREEVALLLKFREEGCGWGEIGHRLDRQSAQCAARYWYLKGGKVAGGAGVKSVKDIEAERARKHATEQRAIEARDRRSLAKIERDERAAQAGDLTPIFFGDPPPGYSALDQRRRA